MRSKKIVEDNQEEIEKTDLPFDEFENAELFELSWGTKAPKGTELPLNYEVPTIKLRYDFNGTHTPLERATKADLNAKRVDVINSSENRNSIKQPRKTKYNKKHWY